MFIQAKGAVTVVRLIGTGAKRNKERGATRSSFIVTTNRQFAVTVAIRNRKLENREKRLGEHHCSNRRLPEHIYIYKNNTSDRGVGINSSSNIAITGGNRKS